MRKSVILLCAAGFATAILAAGPSYAGETKEQKSKGLNFAAIARSIANITKKDDSSKSKSNYSARTDTKYGNLIRSHARKNGVPAKLAEAVVRVESNFNASARGQAGEIGLMQIKLATARSMGYRGSSKGLYDPDTNIKYGMKYLGGAHKLSGGDTCGTILRYNAGHYAKRMNKISSRYCAKVKDTSWGDPAQPVPRCKAPADRLVRRPGRSRGGATGPAVLIQAAALEICRALVYLNPVSRPGNRAAFPRGRGEESPGSTDTRCRITSGGGDPRESATESKPPRLYFGRKASADARTTEILAG